MKKLFLQIIFPIIFVLFCLYQNVYAQDESDDPIINVAEFQPMEGVLIRYPLGIPVSFVATLSNMTTVTTLIGSSAMESTVRTLYTNNNVNMGNVRFAMIPSNSYWTRDYGPWYVIDTTHNFSIVDFTYNRNRPLDNAVACNFSAFLNLNCNTMNMVHTGGNYMTDGYGTAASTTLVINENSSQSVASLRSTARTYLGIENYYFLDDPLGDYIEHIDCWGKFLAVDKVLIGQVATTDTRYNDYEAIADFFENAVTPWGNHYRVYRVFTPGGFSQVTPYTNSLILNDHVFVPVTGSVWDEDAIAAYREAMPGYTVVPVSEAISAPWENTDALHCRTHELADLGMLLIRHYPLLGEQPYAESYTLSADITAMSGQPLDADSALVFYRIDEGMWQTTPLTHISGNRWEATLSNLPGNSKVSYYLFAKDQSQRREMHPYIGAYDPHIFTIGASDITSYTHKEAHIYPNPCNHSLTVNADNMQSVTIYNSIGQAVGGVAAPSSTTTLNTTSLPQGLYIVKIAFGDGDILTKRIIIHHN